MTRMFGGDGFWRDWKALPKDAREDFYLFVDRLQANPYEPSLLRGSQSDRRIRFLYEFHPGWNVGWRTDITAGHVVFHPEDLIEVELLLIKPK